MAATCLALIAQATSSTNGAQPLNVAVVWHVASSAYVDSSVQAAEFALTAPALLGAPLRALRAHSGARFAIAIDPDRLAALERAAAGESALADVMNGRFGAEDPRSADMLRLLGRPPPSLARLANTWGGRRFDALAAAVGNKAARFSRHDIADFAGTAAWLWIAAASPSARTASALNKAQVHAGTALTELARADAIVLSQLKEEVARGALELVAVPANEPVLPLLVDSAGKSALDPNVVEVRAAADAGALVDEAIAAVKKFAPGHAVGLYSPFGAYDDATAELLQRRHVGYALFTDRVVRNGGAGASADSIAAADAAAFQAYSLRVSKSGALAALFWDQEDSVALSTTLPAWPARAMADHIRAAASIALANSANIPGAHILVLSIDSDGAWARRADYADAVNGIAATLAAAPNIAAVTPSEFLRAHADAAAAYGFGASSSAGSFALWMGSTAQASLWSALVAARAAAGGDAALDRPAVRDPLLKAEGARWFEAPQLPQTAADTKRKLAEYRLLLAAVYRGAGKAVPGNLAQVKLEEPPVLNAPAPPAP